MRKQIKKDKIKRNRYEDRYVYILIRVLMCGAYGTLDEYGCDNNAFFSLHSSFLVSTSFSCRATSCFCTETQRIIYKIK